MLHRRLGHIADTSFRPDRLIVFGDADAQPAKTPSAYGDSSSFGRTPGQGADTIDWLAAAEQPARTTGGFWSDRHVRSGHRLARTRETAEDRDRLSHAFDALAAGASARI